MQGIRSQSEIVYDNNGQSYSTLCSDPNIVNAITSAIAAGGDTGTIETRCNATDNAWAINALLKVPEGTSTYWCVDSLGVGRGEAVELEGATQCS